MLFVDNSLKNAIFKMVIWSKYMKKEVKILSKYFSKNPDIFFAFLFGSQTKKIAGRLSDWDIAVYFKPQTQREIEWEETDKYYPQEDKIWNDLVDICKTDNVDFVVLNRAPANIALSAVRGIPLVIRERRIFLDFLLRISRQAEDYHKFVDDYYEIMQRSSSLSLEDKEKLKKIISFLEEEIGLYDYFSSFTVKEYEDIHKRHEVERWVENMVNSAIDVGEVILASEKKKIPDYYKDIFVQLGTLPQFKSIDKETFTRWVKLRNILAHEYLDIKWQRINEFAKNCLPHFKNFMESAKKFL